MVYRTVEVAQTIAEAVKALACRFGGKSEHHRAGCFIT